MTHSFNSPKIRSQEAMERDPNARKQCEALCRELEEAGERAAMEAIRTARECDFRIGNINCPLNISRDVETEDGWWIGNNPQGYSDHTLHVMEFRDQNNKNIAALLNYDMQSSCLDHTDIISSDIVGKTCLDLENQTGGISLFVPGACGDQKPACSGKELEQPDQKTRIKNSQADLFTKAALEAMANSRLVFSANEDPDIEVQARKLVLPARTLPKPGSLKPSKTMDAFKTHDKETICMRLMLGNVVIDGIGAELSSRTGNDIRTRNKNQPHYIFCMINGADKYMPEKSAYERVTYEAQNSGYAKGAAEILADALS